MLRLATLLLIGLCSVRATRAQGTFLFTWHGNANLFQASFSVTEAEMQPGATWDSPLFLGSIAITSPSGMTYHYASPDYAAGGCYANGNGWSFDMGLVYLADGTEVFASGSQYWNDGLINEKPILANQDLWSEAGYWTTAYAPEPSSAALLAVAAAVWGVKRWRRRLLACLASRAPRRL